MRETLTEREAYLFQLVGAGMTQAEIARTIGVSRSRIYQILKRGRWRLEHPGEPMEPPRPRRKRRARIDPEELRALFPGPHLDTRIRGVLKMYGLVSRRQIATMSDRQLSRMRGLGPATIARMREVVPYDGGDA